MANIDPQRVMGWSVVCDCGIFHTDMPFVIQTYNCFRPRNDQINVCNVMSKQLNVDINYATICLFKYEYLFVCDSSLVINEAVDI